MPWEAILGGATGGVAVAIVTVDTDLHTHRIQVYTELWNKTGTLPQWPRNRELTYRDLRTLTAELCSCYFEQGGMYLSTIAWEA